MCVVTRDSDIVRYNSMGQVDMCMFLFAKFFSTYACVRSLLDSYSFVNDILFPLKLY